VPVIRVSPQVVRALAGTLTGDLGTDLLGTSEDATGWLRTAELLPPEARLTNSEHSALLRLRESLRDVLAARAAGREDTDAATRLTRALADGRLVLTVGPAGTCQLASAARASYPNLVAALAIALAETGGSRLGTWAM